MAKIPIFFKTQFLGLTLLSLLATTLVAKAEDDENFMKNLLYKKEKLSHFKFYWHDIVSGKNPTNSVIVKPATNNTATFFGSLSIFDDALTEGPDIKSRLLGRAQGLYGFASQDEVALLMAMNFVFVQGEYNGSTITILGRNSAMKPVREMPVIGGSGAFRFARGYAQASTFKFDLVTGNAIVEYNVYVLHY